MHTRLTLTSRRFKILGILQETFAHLINTAQMNGLHRIGFDIRERARTPGGFTTDTAFYVYAQLPGTMPNRAPGE